MCLNDLSVGSAPGAVAMGREAAAAAGLHYARRRRNDCGWWFARRFPERTAGMILGHWCAKYGRRV